MSDITEPLLMVFLIIGLGAGLKRFVFPDPDSWRIVDRINYFVLFPSLLTFSLATADLGTIAVGPIAATLLAGIATGSLLTLVLRPALRLKGPQFSSMFQGAVRWNTFVALATVTGLGLDQGLALVALVVAVVVPTVNILCVIVLARTNGDGPTPYAMLPGLLLRNPLILACLVGALLNGRTVLIETPFGDMVAALGRAAMPLGLIAVGAGLDLGALKGRTSVLAVTTVVKLIAMPVIFAGWAALFGISGPALTVVIIAGAVPTATSSYVLARQLGGDAELMAGLVTATTLGAIATMPFMIWLLV